MTGWHSQHYIDAGRAACIDETLLQRAVATAQQTLIRPHPGPAILTLGHLGHLTGIPVDRLKTYVSREGKDSYRVFTIRKRPIPRQRPRYRFIAVPEPSLLLVQTWIATEILNHVPCHPASTAFAPGSRLAAAAARYCGAQWLIKVDIRDFFESITEIDVYRVFRERGYQPLVAFQLGRICTRLRDKHRELGSAVPERRRSKSHAFSGGKLVSAFNFGVLPQGAPTSPMLANHAVYGLDEKLTLIASACGLTYSRYADDLTFSTKDKGFGRARVHDVIGQIYRVLGARGLSPNRAKTMVASPGSRKIVLGLLVAGSRPRLTREFRSKLRMHLHFIAHPDHGPAQHAKARGFSSVEGLRQHLFGLVGFAGQMDPAYADKCRSQMRLANWNLSLSAFG